MQWLKEAEVIDLIFSVEMERKLEIAIIEKKLSRKTCGYQVTF